MHAFPDRREIIAFGTPGSEPMRELEQRVEDLQCLLADCDVDMRYVDSAELEAQGDRGVDHALDRLARLRGDEMLPFELVLIGKDGGVKARDPSPAALEAFLRLIDTMPMRRAEMRQAGGADRDCRDGESTEG